MADVASKQQTTALFLSTRVKPTRKHTELTTKKLTNLMGNLCCAREHSVQFFVQFFFYTVKLRVYWALHAVTTCRPHVAARPHEVRLAGHISIKVK
jgi:hypothetical protein